MKRNLKTEVELGNISSLKITTPIWNFFCWVFVWTMIYWIILIGRIFLLLGVSFWLKM